MQLSIRIAPHLPYLRRFARSITGSQKSGDAYVAATLEALIADPSIFPDASNDQIALYRLFVQLLESASVPEVRSDSEFAWERQAAARLENLSPLSRQAFLLVSVEGFTVAQAGEILGLGEGETGQLLDRASREISQHLATRVLIIEDEPLIAMDIEQLVESLGHTVVGIARTHSEALEIHARERPAMVLADIQLADGSSGIDAVNDILRKVAVPVIFITAFPERLLTGERPEPAFLITKPFNPDMVKALIGQALFFSQNVRAAA